MGVIPSGFRKKFRSEKSTVMGAGLPDGRKSFAMLKPCEWGAPMLQTDKTATAKTALTHGIGR